MLNPPVVDPPVGLARWTTRYGPAAATTSRRRARRRWSNSACAGGTLTIPGQSVAQLLVGIGRAGNGAVWAVADA